MSRLAVVDCGMGNLHSVVAGVRRACPNSSVTVTTEAAAIEAADKVILPGDGNFGACMREIDARGLREALCAAARQKPFLGICVGMQVLFRGSEEADEAGLGLFDGTVRRLPDDAGIKIPHIGWNTMRRQGGSPFTDDIGEGDYFYFVHSYCAPLGDWALMTCDYGAPFAAVIGAGNLLATQFHPEKSGAAGIRLLKRFVDGDVAGATT